MSDRQATFVFIGQIRSASERGLLIEPRDFRLPRTPAEWFPKRLTHIVAHEAKERFVQVSVPLWLARQKFPAEMLAQGEVRARSVA
jgi:hypothetical protein